MDQKLVTETVITEHVFSLRRLVNSFTDVSFLMVANGEKVFWAAGIFLKNFFGATSQLATEINWQQWRRIKV